MKKALFSFSFGLLTITSANAFADGAYHGRPDYKDEIVKAAKPHYDWLKNLSGNMTLTSNYVFRGISQSSNQPAVQGGLTYAFPWGIYFNAWGSSIRFDANPGASIELDAIAGITNNITDDLSYDVNVARFYYPKASILEYNELNGSLTYKIFKVAMAYSGNVYNVHKTGIYYNGGVSYDIPSNYLFSVENVNVAASYGHYSLPRAAGNSYNDYMASISKKIKNYTLMVQWTDTNHRQNTPPYDQSQVLASVTADF